MNATMAPAHARPTAALDVCLFALPTRRDCRTVASIPIQHAAMLCKYVQIYVQIYVQMCMCVIPSAGLYVMPMVPWTRRGDVDITPPRHKARPAEQNTELFPEDRPTDELGCPVAWAHDPFPECFSGITSLCLARPPGES